MRRNLFIALLVLCTLLTPPAQASATDTVLDPDVEAALAAAGTDGMVTVRVDLVAQADLSDVGGQGRADRSRAVVARLKAATAGQAALIGRLRALEATGKVADFVSFWIFNGLILTAEPDVVTEIAARSDVAAVTLPPTVIPAGSYDPAVVEPNLEVINAPALWALGHTGEGVVVASLDTGVHLGSELAATYRNTSGSWFDPYGQHSTPADLDGHGTATLGVIVGRDAGGSAVGVAPDATWIAAKIFNDSGSATSAAIHAAFQWALDPDGDPGTDDVPDVVNNSWTNESGGCSLEFQPDLAALRAAEIIPVFAAGNFGPSGASSRSPANLPEALAVGATTNGDVVVSSSSRGPSACAGDAEFPDLTAPGSSIKVLDNSGLYTYATGTSLAAPHVTGALALLLSAQPGLSSIQQETALFAGAVDLGASGPDSTFGVGRLDVAAALANIPPNQPPIASFTVVKGKKGFYDFDGSASSDPDGSSLTFAWDFGDGTTGGGVTISHKFSGSGPFTVTLTVTDFGGAQDATSSAIGGSGGGGGGGGGGHGKGGGGGRP